MNSGQVIVEDETPFGVYILTYPGDFHLSTILVRSIQQVNPTVPIMIIPGEGFDYDDHPFDVPVMPIPAGTFWPEMGHADRKCWSFQGPFETFLYLDADTICTKSLDALIERIAQQDGDFIYVQPWIDEQEWRSAIEDPGHPNHASYVDHVAPTIGDGPLAKFDPDHDFFAKYPFNTGLFASRRLVLKENDFASLNKAERSFYRDQLHLPDWKWSSQDLFFIDQGRINYLVVKLSVPIFSIEPEIICPSGASANEILFEDVEQNRCQFHFIHWMGAKSPSPSFLSGRPFFFIYAILWSFVGRRSGRWIAPGYEHLKECVGYSLWKHYYERSFDPMPLAERLRWTWKDVKRVSKLLVRSLRIVLRPNSLG